MSDHPMRFVSVKRRDGTEVWLNPHSILSIEDCQDGTIAVEFTDGQKADYLDAGTVMTLIGGHAPAADRSGEREPARRSGRGDRPRGQEATGSGTYRWMSSAKYAANCARCGRQIFEGDAQLFDVNSRDVWCRDCVTEPGRNAEPLPPIDRDGDRAYDDALDRDSSPSDRRG